MKTSFLTLAAVALLLAGCSKQEITENISDGTSLVATPTNGLARLGRAGNQPSVKFKNNRIVIGLNNTKTDEEVPLDELLADGGGTVVLTNNETTPPTIIQLPLTNNGNENQRYRTPQFELSATMENELFDIEIQGADGSYLWGASIFMREDGKAVENDPELARARVKEVNNPEELKLVLVTMDDPTEQISKVKFVPSPAFENPDDPTVLTQGETVVLNKSHVNTNIGLARWTGRTGRGSSAHLDGETFLLSNNTYGVPFLTEETNAQIIGKYSVSVDLSGETSIVLSDEPEILGSRLGSTSFGEQWQLEIAIADLGDWVETVNYVFTAGEGPSPLVAELPMQLTRTEGNLRVYTSAKFSFNGNPTGFNYGGIVYQFGTGTRSSAGRAHTKAELL